MAAEIHVKNCDYSEVEALLNSDKFARIFLVCDSSYEYLKISSFLDSFENIVKFSHFSPNPLYESVCEAVEKFRSEKCDAILAIGGGSAMDLAKCVKLYANMSEDEIYLTQEVISNDIPLIAMPTTAGTGSEATRYAVIYYNGEKQSITHNDCIPTTVIFDPSVLETLPDYQRKSTVLDALCHSMESYWSINSDDESREYSKRALSLILENLDRYLNKDSEVYPDMLKAANFAGRAINISQTTAGHAMCYKLTSLYGIAHGHAAALCVNSLLPYMVRNTDKCSDSRGSEYLEDMFSSLAKDCGCSDTGELCEKFSSILSGMNFKRPDVKEGDIAVLSGSVNPVRLKNNPVKLDTETINRLYEEILL